MNYLVFQKMEKILNISENLLRGRIGVEGRDFEYFFFEELKKESDELLFFSIFCYIKNKEKDRKRLTGLDFALMAL